MNGYYLFIFILTLFGNSLANFPNVTIQHVCENEMLFLKCLNINETIQIVRSMYGRTSQRICNHDLTSRVFDKTCANIEQSKYQTKNRCHGKSICQMLISNHLFTDPCGSNIPKHFEVHYRCINRGQICSNLFANCSKMKDLKCVEKVQEEFSCQCPSSICQYVNKQLIGFIENSCPEENLQGFHWPKTFINKGQVLSCPSPCTGEIFRSCDSNSQWSITNYTHCKCPIDESDQLSTHRSANSYVFQCNFWLINRILPKDNSCIHSFTNWNDKTINGSFNCLVRAFQQMKFQSCLNLKSFGIDFQNLDFEIYIPLKNESRFDLLGNEISIDRTDIIKENFRENLPMMIIDTKFSHPKNQSIILIEQENDLNSLQTANVTLVFHHQSAEFRYQCRAYHSTNFSFDFNSSNMFFACQLLCSNGSHVICQCPFFNPFMHYVLHIDRSRTESDLMIDNDLSERCVQGNNRSMEEKIDRYVKEIPSLNFAKKVLLFMERMIEKEIVFTNWKIIKHIEELAFRLSRLTNSFISINDHIEFIIKSNENQLENHDRSVSISFRKKTDINLILFFTLSNLRTQQFFNSRIVSLNILPNNNSFDQIQITLRHLNNTNQISTCVSLKNQYQWNADGCQLLATNFTHSICSCQYSSIFALMIDSPKADPIIKSNENHLLVISKIGCIISIVCVLLTIVICIIMRSNANDDLTTVRNILHTNMFLCLIVVQVLFVFGIDQNKNKTSCRIISILLDYFLLATYSWMFVDGIELSIALKHVFKIDRIRILAYSLYSYGFPLLIVLLSLTLSAKTGNGLSRYCWLSHDNAFIWAFAVPFALLILGNLSFFLISIHSICKNLNPTKQGFSLRDISLISILFGLTWIIALFYLYDQTILFAYIFTLLNSFHGILILIFYCLLQINIRDLMDKFRLGLSFFDRNNPKSLDCFSLPDNTSSSGYSSGHSSDLNHKQPIDINPKYSNHLSQQIYDRRICPTNETCYLPSIPINLLTNRLSTFRYQLPSNEMILTQEQKEELLKKNSIQDDEHQYYEIG